MNKAELFHRLDIGMGLVLHHGREVWSLVGEPRHTPDFTSFSIIVSTPHRVTWLDRKRADLKKLFSSVKLEEENQHRAVLMLDGLPGDLIVLDACEPFGFFDAVFSLPEHVRAVFRKLIKMNRKQITKACGIPPTLWPENGYRFKEGNLYLVSPGGKIGKILIPSAEIFYKMFGFIPEIAQHRAAVLNEGLQ